jgi:hypothetical protein
MTDLIDDATADLYLTEIDKVTGDDRLKMANALEKYADSLAEKRRQQTDEHFSKLFTDEAYFEQQKAANTAVQESIDPDQTAKSAAIGAWLEHHNGRPIDPMSYQVERDAFAMANYGKKNLDDNQLFDFIRGEYDWQKQRTEAINDLQMQAVGKAITDSQLGQNRPFVDGMTEVFNQWQQKYPELVDGKNDAAFLSQGYKLYYDTINDLDTVRPQASKALSTLTSFTQGNATDEEMQSLANDFVGAPPEDRQKIYKYVTLAAQAGQIDRAGIEQFAINMGQAFTRGFDFVPQGTLQMQEAGVNNWLESIRNGTQIWVPADGDLTKAVVGNAPAGAESDAWRQATVPEAETLIQSGQNVRESFKVVRELRNVAKTGVDPIRPVLEENSFWGTAERGAYGLSGSIPLMGATAVNPFLGVLAYQSTEYDRIMLENPDINPQFAQGLALVEGAANAAIDRVQLSSISGRLPMFGRYLDRIASDGVRRTVKIGANVVEQNLQEGAQDLIAPVLETAVASLREDMPDKDFTKLMDDWSGQRAETFFATLPLALIGGGVATYRDIKNPSAELNATKLRMAGFGQDQVTFIQRAENPEEYDARIKMEWEKRTPENIKAGEQEVLNTIEKARTPGELDARMQRVTAPDGSEDIVVTSPDGKELLRTKSEQAALEAVRQHNEAQLINERNAVSDMVDYFRAQDPANVATIEAPRTVQQELDRLTEAGDSKGIANLNERIRFAGIPEGSDLTTYNILGEANVETTAEGVFRGVIKLRENSRPEDAFEEINHVFVRKALAEGRTDLDSLRGWLNQTSEATGEIYATETETDIIENIAKVGMDYAAGRIEETSLPASFVDYIKRMLQVFKETMARAIKLKDAFATGKIDSNFETLLADSVGLNQQARVDTASNRVIGELTQGLFNYSIGQQVSTDTNFSIGNPAKVDENGIHSFAKPRPSTYATPNESQFDPSAILETLVRGKTGANSKKRRKHGRTLASFSEIVDWAESQGRTIDPSIFAERKELGSGGEHLVFQAEEGRVYKLTKPGLFGIQADDAGAYLQRWALANRLFNDDARIEGIVKLTGESDYRTVVSHRHIDGRDSTQAEIKDYLQSHGFVQVESQWIHPTLGIAALDADTAGNSITMPDGTVAPVDLNLQPASPQYLQQAREQSGLGGVSNFSIGIAPNGTPSNLKPEEQALAKSPEFKQWGGNWEALSHKQFLNGDPVSILAGGEFKKIDGQSLIDRVASWFASKHQNKAINSVVGEVALTKNGVSDSLAHGIGRDKADAFAAVPEVISKGRVVDYQKNWKGRGYDSVTLAAPIQIAGKDFIAVAIVIREQSKQRFYLHEVGLRERLQQSDAFKSGASAEEQASVEPSGARSEGAIKNLLRGIFSVNPESVTVKTDENGEPLASEIARFRQETGTSNYSIASQSEIDRVNRALGGMNRGPDARLAVYERAKAKLIGLMQSNQASLDDLKKGTVSFRRTQILQALGELDAILSIFPPDLRGRVGGYTKLASIAPHDVFKDGEKVSEVSGMNGAIISAWMREGQNIGQAGQQTELPPGYTAKENLGTARADRAISDFFKKRIEMIDRELEKTLRREYDEAFRKLLDRTKPKKAAPGEKPKGIGGDIQDLFAVVRDSVDMNATQVAAHIAGLDSMIASGELTAEQEAREQIEAALVALTGDWKNADSDRRRTALTEATRIWSGAYAAHTQKVIRQREEREIARAESIIATGKDGDMPGRASKAISDSGLKGTWKDYILNLLNFDQVVGVLFGENTEFSNTIIDKQRLAENAKEDGSQTKMQGLEDFFSGLAGGNLLAGERLRYQLTQPIMTVNDIQMSQLEGLSAVMMWAQEDGRRHMEGERDENGRPSGKWNYDQAFVDEITTNLSAEALALRDWLSKQYAAEYANINAVYSELNGVNLPQIQNYSPVTVQPVNAPAGQVLDPVSGSAMSGASTSPGALRTRGTSIAEPRFQDALQTYIAHTLQMEHWKAFAPMLSEVNGILRNRDVQNSVQEKGGAEARKVLNLWLDYFGQGGNRDAGAHLALNQGLNNVLGRASQVALVGRISTLLIQSTQLGAALAEVPVGPYLKRMGKLLSGQLSWDAAINSDYIQRRIKQMPPVVQMAMQGLKGAKPTAIQQAGKRLGMLLSGADGLFTAGTYAIVYDWHLSKAKELGLAGQQAEDYARNTAERATDRIAQPTRAGARSLYENTQTDPLARAGWAFASEARKNLALVAYSFAERDTATKLRTIAYVLALNAIGSQILRSIWRDTQDDDDEELFDEKYWNPKRFLMAAATEPLYGIPVFGSMLEEAVYKSAGEYNPQTSLFSVASAVGPIKRLPDHLSGDTEMRDVFSDIDKIISSLGVMHSNIAATASITHLAKDLFGLADSAVDATTED